jgi:hypothetical protein
VLLRCLHSRVEVTFGCQHKGAVFSSSSRWRVVDDVGCMVCFRNMHSVVSRQVLVAETAPARVAAVETSVCDVAVVVLVAWDLLCAGIHSLMHSGIIWVLGWCCMHPQA